jgi:hypothetical protein
VDHSELTWRKSSHSGQGTGADCVEVARLPLLAAVRDSKNPSCSLSFPTSSWTTFLERS